MQFSISFLIKYVLSPRVSKRAAQDETNMNLLSLLNECLVGFGITTRAALEQQKKETLQVLKKVN